MESENFINLNIRPCSKIPKGEMGDDRPLWRQCGCLRTSEKLKQILKAFPAPPPPMPRRARPIYSAPEHTYTSLMGEPRHSRSFPTVVIPAGAAPVSVYHTQQDNVVQTLDTVGSVKSRTWSLLKDTVQVVQVTVTATELALYYFIYCYMQFVYFTLKSLIYFFNADGPMKITIGVVTITSAFVGINILLRVHSLIHVF